MSTIRPTLSDEYIDARCDHATLPYEYTTGMLYPMRKTTGTHAHGALIPNTHVEDDLRHPNTANKVLEGLPEGAN